MKYILGLYIIFFIHVAKAQDTLKPTHPIPRRAAILSAILPGSGQVYNHLYSTKKRYNVYWKVPIIYTSLYLASQSLINKINLEKEIRTEYYNRINHNSFSAKWDSYDNYNLILLQKNASKSRNTMFFLTGGIYVIQIIEASIDAHFSKFDISPNLTLNIQPFYLNFNFSGLTFALNVK
jgi:hypothetical protein